MKTLWLLAAAVAFAALAPAGGAETFRRTVKCPAGSVWVRDEPDFVEGGVEAFRGPFGEIAFLEGGQPVYCTRPGFGWSSAGFSRGSRGGAAVLLFVLEGGTQRRYFDVRGAREVFAVSPPGVPLVVAEEPRPEPGTPKSVEQVWEGRDSAIDKAEIHRIRSAAAWSALWRRHRPGQPAPSVDFRRMEVVAVARGSTVNESGVSVEDLREKDGVLRLRFWAKSYQTGNYFDRTTPFGFFVVARSPLLLVVEEKEGGLIGGPFDWVERARLEAQDGR